MHLEEIVSVILAGFAGFAERRLLLFTSELGEPSVVVVAVWRSFRNCPEQFMFLILINSW